MFRCDKIILKWERMVLIIVKIDKTVIKETKYITAFVLIFSVLMQSVFLILHHFQIATWDYKVLLGNLWGAGIAIGNFFVMGLYVQKALTKEADDAKKTMKVSQSVRFVAILLLAAVGLIIPVFNKIAVVLPLLFPSFAIFMRPIFNKKK